MSHLSDILRDIKEYANASALLNKSNEEMLNQNNFGSKTSPHLELDSNTDKIFVSEKTCPVCKKIFKFPSVKTSSIRIDGRDSDYKINYKGANPLLYEVLVCEHCGYASTKSQFDKMSKEEALLIVENIYNKWSAQDFKSSLTHEDGIRNFKLALLSSRYRKVQKGDIALLYLKMSWIAREMNDSLMELRFQEEAIPLLEESYVSDKFPILGLNEYHVLFLVGELSRRIGDYEKSKLIFSEILASRDVEKKIKDSARNQKDLLLSN